jgi:hypothetical protein
MGFRQEHGKVLKLQVVQSLFGYIPHEERWEHEESFEAACRSIMGKSWDDSGLSMESAEGLPYYLRGVASASGKPITFNHRKVMLGLSRSVLSLESRLSACDTGTLAGAIIRPQLEEEAGALLKRYGLDALSTEGKVIEAMKAVGGMLKAMFKSKPKAPGKQEEPFDPKKVDWNNVHKMADYIEDASFPFKEGEEHTQRGGKVSGEGIVKNLTWGHEFDEKNPLEFLKKKFAAWDKFYQGWEQVTTRYSAAVMADEKSTRAAINTAREDDEKMEEILDKAVKALRKVENPSDYAAKTKCDFPGARTLTVDKRHDLSSGYDITEVVQDKAFKDISQIRPLTQAEARALLIWLKERVMEMKKYGTIFDKAHWSDHSDGDAIWDQTEHINNEEYAIMVYHQTCDADFFHHVDDISEMLAKLSNGIMTWVDRSFSDTDKKED